MADGIVHLGGERLTATSNRLDVNVKATNAVRVKPIIFTLDTNAYADGDVLAETQELASAFADTDGTGLLQTITLNDKDDQGIALTVVVMDANRTLGTENAAVSMSDAHGDDILATVPVTASEWVDMGGFKTVTLRNLAIPVKAVSGGTSLYVGLVARGAGTFSAAGITGRFGIVPD